MTSFQMFKKFVSFSGSKRHQSLIEKCETHEVSGCFCMTEMSHGSNIRELKTTATYDPKAEV
jgi:acyl-CoA oxidase